MGLDYITGIMKGYFGSVLDSERGWKGLLKKAGYLVIVATFFQAGRYMGSTPEAALFARSLAIHALIINEFLSILENTRQIVIPEGEPEQKIPKGILDLSEELVSDKYADKIVGSKKREERREG
jgi:toxin secretion/phage lysis holin